MSRKNKYSLFFSLLTVFAILSGGCADDHLFDDTAGWRPNRGDQPLELICEMPELVGTRSMVNPKINFSESDVIHVEGCFKMKDSDGNDLDDLYLYGAFSYDGTTKKWISLSDDENDEVINRIYWPNNAVSGKFKAYYVSQKKGSMDMLTPGTGYDPVSFSNLGGNPYAEDVKDTYDKDPLMAEIEAVPYGHTIRLQFKHALSYLTITELPAGVHENFWFEREISPSIQDPNFNNAYRLVLSADKKLSLEYLRIKDPAYNDAVYVEGITEDLKSENGQVIKSQVGFFLEPGRYSCFVLKYPEGDVVRRYFSFTSSNNGKETPDDPSNVMEMNNKYIFDVTRSAGIEIELDDNSNQWDESDDIERLTPVEVEEFLYAISKGEEYTTHEGVKVLSKTGTGSMLVKNVSFEYFPYTILSKFPDKYQAELNTPYFTPNVPNGQVFEGNHKFIWNMGAPLFRYNSGTVRNLGIRNAKMNVITDENYTVEGIENETFDISRQGAICGQNSGILQTIRLWDVDIMAGVSAAQTYDSDGYPEALGETHLIGLLAGSIADSGIIQEVYMQGNFNLTVDNYYAPQDPGDDNDDNDEPGNGDPGTTEPDPENYFTPAVNCGGLVGGNTNLLQNVSAWEGTPEITINFRCYGSTGAYYLGGITGINSGGTITNINLKSIIIRAINSFGNNLYLGGLVGQMNAGQTNSGYISACMVNGSVYAGITKEYGTFESYSFTGGMVGEISTNVSMFNCRAVVDVYGPQQGTDGVNIDPKVAYGVGGIFGNIAESIQGRGEISDLTFNGSTIRVNTTYDNIKGGKFAGYAPNGQNAWDDNYSNKYIDLPGSINLPEIGGILSTN